jgi:hypothetical protein
MVVVAGGVECVFVCGEMGNAGTGGGYFWRIWYVSIRLVLEIDVERCYVRREAMSYMSRCNRIRGNCLCTSPIMTRRSI